MKKVAIIGSGGSGKSTLALEIGRRLELPVYHLDKLFWSPNWVKRPQQEWREFKSHYAPNQRGSWTATTAARWI